jgi:hypothetical protein
VKNLFVDYLESTTPQDSITLVSTVRGRAGAIEIQVQPADVTEILRFTMSGHVFAYRITALPVTVDGSGKRTPLGSEERLAFYDMDGSGRFTVMRDAGSFEPFVPLIPDWVKRLEMPARDGGF